MSDLSNNKGFHANDSDLPDHWYVQQGARLQGPYTADDIRRYLLLGRVRHSDRVSRDGDLWEPVTQVPELIPEELLDLESEQGWREYLAKYRHVDERTEVRDAVASHREAPEFTAPQYNHIPIDADRRVTSDGTTVRSVRQEWSNVDFRNTPDVQPRFTGISLLPVSLLGLTLLALLVVIYLNTVSPLL